MLPFKIATFFITFWIHYFFFQFSHFRIFWGLMYQIIRIYCYMVSENRLSKQKWNQSFINKRIKKTVWFFKECIHVEAKEIQYYKIKPCKLSIFIDYQIDRLIIQEFINETLSMYMKWICRFIFAPIFHLDLSFSLDICLWISWQM